MIATTLVLLGALFQHDDVNQEPQSWSGTITEQSQVVSTPALKESFSETPTVGQVVSFSVLESGPYFLDLRSFAFDSYLVLANEAGQPLIENDDGWLATHSLVQADLEAGLKYQAICCALHGGRGDFDLKLIAGEPPSRSPEQLWQAKVDNAQAKILFLENLPEPDLGKIADEVNELGFLYFEAGEFDLAEEQLGRVIDLHRQTHGEQSLMVASDLFNFGVLYYLRKDLSKAEKYYNESLEIRQQLLEPQDEEILKVWIYLSILHESRGSIQKAIECQREILSVYVLLHGEEHAEVAKVNNEIGLLYARAGSFQKARPFYERALAIRNKVLGPKHPLVAEVENNLARLWEELGNFDAALELYESAVAIWEETSGPAHPDTAVGLNNLGSLHYHQGNARAALPFYQRASEIWENAYGPDSRQVAISWDNLAVALRELGELEQALPLHKKSLAYHERNFGDLHPATCNSLNNLATLYWQLKDFDAALPLQQRALDGRLAIGGPSHPRTVNSLINTSLFYRDVGDLDLALEYMMRAMRGTLDHLDQELPTLSESARLQFLKISATPGRMLPDLVAAESPPLEQAYSLFLEWKGKATRMQRASLRLSQQPVSPELEELRRRQAEVAGQLAELVLLPMNRQGEDHAEVIAAMRSHRLELERKINRELGIEQALKVPTLKAMREAMPEGSVLVDFFADDRVYAWVIGSDRGPDLFDLGPADPIRKQQQLYLSQSSNRGSRALSGAKGQPGRQLFDLLWKPLSSSIGDAQLVLLSPDGFLCELPFGILQDSDKEYLLEKFRFGYLTDPTSLSDSQLSPSQQEGPMLAVGNVNYFRREDASFEKGSRLDLRSRMGTTWKSLPATADEMQALGDLHEFVLEWSTPLIKLEGKAATEERVRAELAGKRYIHIATHGYFEPDDLPSLLLDAAEKQAEAELGEQIQAVGLLPGLLSGLVFAGVNGEPDPNRDDGYLSAEEIQHIDLSACQLVVLSACETALGSARAGEGLISLRRSFAVAGANTVISSLWKVDDDATALLMQDFYTNLWQKEMDPGEALHQAKLRMLRRNRVELGEAMPSTWGAFVLSGDWN